MRHILKTGQKNSRLGYYLTNLGSLAIPNAFYRHRLAHVLNRISELDAAVIHERVNYYNRISTPFVLDYGAQPFHFSLFKGQRNYYMDLYEYLRYFDPAMRIRFRFGDITQVPPFPTLVKARPIGDNNAHSILFNLNKVRHFVFIRDDIPYEDKMDKLVWRGHALRENRKRFLRMYYDHERCDVGHAHKRKKLAEWRKPYLSIGDHLTCKFILSLEGNDVASNLKWIMSSNSLCFMPRPKYESWFMEGTLVAGQHYVAIRDDYTDLEENIDYYSHHTEEALVMIKNAHDYVERFRNKDVEDLVSLMVLKKYFERSGQWVGQIGNGLSCHS